MLVIANNKPCLILRSLKRFEGVETMFEEAWIRNYFDVIYNNKRFIIYKSEGLSSIIRKPVYARSSYTTNDCLINKKHYYIQTNINFNDSAIILKY